MMKVKDCPFCGVKPKLLTEGTRFYFACPGNNCPMYFSTTRTYKTLKLLIEAWDTRKEKR